METEQLRQLEAVARMGTVTAAAEELHVTQPALSRGIRRLESELGCELLERVGRHVEINEAGRIVLDYARQMLRDERLMRDALADHARQARALAVGTVAPAPLWRLTALLVERFPQTVLTSRTLTQHDVERGIMDGTLDLAISLRPLMLPTVRSAQLMTESLSIALPAEHSLAHRESLSAADLDGETILLFAQIGFWRGYCDCSFARSHFVVQEDRTVFEQLVRTTELPFFVSDAPAFGATPLPESHVVIPLRDTDAHATFYLLTRTDARSEAASAFDWVAGQ